MSDDLEARLRDRLRGAPLPAAPETLRDYLAHLPLDVQPSGPPRRQLRPRVLLGVAAIVVLGLGVGTVLVGAPPDASPTAPPTAPPSIEPTAPRSPSTGVRRFEAPGISFDYPVDWIDQTSTVEFPRVPGVRFVVLLGRGMPVCPPRFGSTSKPTPEPGSCQEQVLAPGSMVVSVLELTNPMPGTTGRGPKRKVAGYPAWEEQVSAEPANPTQLQWTIQAPDGSLYLVTAGFPRADLAARRTDIGKVLGSLRLSAWQAPPDIVNGHVHLDSPEGFSFDYPAAWTVYYPQDASMMDHGVVTVASRPVTPPCPSDSCQRFTTPRGAVVIEFRVGGGLGSPNWAAAPTTIGGQPAFLQPWGPQNATGADEGQAWNVRLTDRTSLSVYVSIRGPNLPKLRAAADEVLGSVRITALPSPSP
jgi:hypothetical protein